MSRPFLLQFAVPATTHRPDRAVAPVDLRELVARLVPALPGGPAGATQPVVLLLAYPRNPDAVRLERALLARGVPSLLLGSTDLVAAATITWRGGGRRATGELCWDGHRAQLSGLRGVWFGLTGTGVPAVAGPAERTFASTEWRAAIEGWWRSCPVPFVNPPDAGVRAGNKITSLEAAAQAGLAVPDTLVTNDPRAAAEFAAQYGRLVAKSLHTHFVELDGRRHSLFTRALGPDDLARLDALPPAPCAFQPLLARRADIRVAVAGERVLAAEIRSAGADQVDVRQVVRHLPMTPHELPASVAERCRDLVAGLGLRYAALDLLWTPDGGYVFLDLNPRGGWWFVEERTGLPISAAVADLFAAAPPDPDPGPAR